MHANIFGIEQSIRDRYPRCRIEWRITAFSYEPSQEMVEVLSAASYTIVRVQSKPDAADEALTNHGRWALFNRRIHLCVLATQDSGALFANFVRDTRKRHIVHCIGVDYVPASFAANEESSSLIRGDVTRFLRTEPIRPLSRPQRQDVEALSSAVVPPVPLPLKKHVVPTSRAATPLDVLENNAWLFFGADPDKVKDADHRALFAGVLAYVMELAFDGWRGTPLELFKDVRSRWRGPAPPDTATLQRILRVVESRLFARNYTLTPRIGEMREFLERHPEIASTAP